MDGWKSHLADRCVLGPERDCVTVSVSKEALIFFLSPSLAGLALSHWKFSATGCHMQSRLLPAFCLSWDLISSYKQVYFLDEVNFHRLFFVVVLRQGLLKLGQVDDNHHRVLLP